MNHICSIFKIKRKIVSFSWIGLQYKRMYKKITKCLNNENFMPIINDKNLKKEFIDYYKLKSWHGFYLPDVYDENNEWLNPKFDKKEKYIFAGGVNNRDWDTLISVVKETPEIKYIIVSGKNDIKNKYLSNNIEYFEELPTEEYYGKMKNAFITICPLKDNKVSGLINIIKSIQYGIPCITTDLNVTSIYYPDSMKNLLYEKNNPKMLKDIVYDLYSMDNTEYENVVKKLQEKLQEDFNPQKIVKKLIDEMKNRKWI